MAEGGKEAIPTVDGSDIVFEFVCTPCAADGSRFEALHLCPTCDQFLCDTCTKYHQRFTKDHRLAPAASKHQNVQAPAGKKAGVAKCHYHPDRNIEMYCGTHDMVYCSLCIATEHRSCHDVDQLTVGVHKSNTAKLQQLVADIDQAFAEIRSTKHNKFTNKRMLETRKENILEEIDKLRNEVNDHFKQLESKLKAELDQESNKIDEELSDEIDAADNLLMNLGETKPDLLNTYDDTDMFIAEKLGNKVVADARAYLSNSDPSTQVTQHFELNQLLYNAIKAADRLGQIVRIEPDHRQTKLPKYVVKSCKRSYSTVDPTGMCQLKDGTILLVDYRSGELKKLDDQANVNAFCDLLSTPFGICSVSSKEVAVRYRYSIQFVHVGKSLCPGKTIKMKGLLTPHEKWNRLFSSIVFCAGTLWTICDNCIYIYSTSGDLVKTIRNNVLPNHSNFQPRSLAVSNDGSKVYATVGEDTTIVFDNNGDVVSELCDYRLIGTRGICVTDDDVVMVGGYYSHNVVMFDKDGDSLGELVPSKNMPFPPQSLCYDRKKCRLLVGFDCEKLQIYELSKFRQCLRNSVVEL